MKTSFRNIFVVCIICIASLTAQTQVTMEVMPNARPTDAYVLIYGASNISQRINYSDINGSPFLHDEWLLADLYSDNNQKWHVKSKLNLVTGEIHFLPDSGAEELAVPAGLIRSFVFFQNAIADSTSGFFTLQATDRDAGTANDYIQVLNHGTLQLLKRTRRQIMKAPNSLQAKPYYYQENQAYFLRSNQQMLALKRLSEDQILPNLTGVAGLDKWISDNKINFKKEPDIVRLLNYYNSSKAVLINNN
jgi:hypothetical protein